ncbi:MAG: ABC transporter ATP-binding protein [Planctomycetota bacterium]
MKQMFLKTTDLKKSYKIGRHFEPALLGVDMEVEQGEFVSIVGPSGCGKSTLLHLLGGLHRPTSGKIFFDGLELTALSDAHLTELRRKSIGFIFQRFNILPTLTARGNIEIALKIRGENTTDGVDEVLDSVGLGGKKHHRPSELSMGEQQRVAIARAVISKAKLLLADEPTGNLDSRNSEQVLDIFHRLNKEHGQTILMITHNREAAETAGRILRMKDGKIVA